MLARAPMMQYINGHTLIVLKQAPCLHPVFSHLMRAGCMHLPWGSMDRVIDHELTWKIHNISTLGPKITQK